MLALPTLGPLGSPFPVLQWHHETFSLPRGGVRLASSDACTTQAFRWTDRVYGLQFHVEIDPALAVRIQPQLEPVRLDDEAVSEASHAGRSVLDRFLRLTLDQPGRTTAPRTTEVAPATAVETLPIEDRDALTARSGVPALLGLSEHAFEADRSLQLDLTRAHRPSEHLLDGVEAVTDRAIVEH